MVTKTVLFSPNFAPPVWFIENIIRSVKVILMTSCPSTSVSCKIFSTADCGGWVVEFLNATVFSSTVKSVPAQVTHRNCNKDSYNTGTLCKLTFLDKE